MNRSVRSLLRGAVLAPVAAAVTVAAAPGVLAGQGSVGGPVREGIDTFAPVSVAPAVGKVAKGPSAAVDGMLGVGGKARSVKGGGHADVQFTARRALGAYHTATKPRSAGLDHTQEQFAEVKSDCKVNNSTTGQGSGTTTKKPKSSRDCSGNKHVATSSGEDAPEFRFASDTALTGDFAPVNGRLARTPGKSARPARPAEASTKAQADGPAPEAGAGGVLRQLLAGLLGRPAGNQRQQKADQGTAQRPSTAAKPAAKPSAAKPSAAKPASGQEAASVKSASAASPTAQEQTQGDWRLPGFDKFRTAG
ncbi:hypothetical protein Acsp04_39530 [Actinomadura sp. NBRC 104425]|uniref:hypothetical protein n=1 Tax=Actinomadura sp. NBRC 104425 TaxID=3032204 RepID=UPI0024A55285|nr:hypothetical protein [Actinomadura sp. NBRC 104425]GLZ13718.1 hypothetical protein Acsp04_39530 [Actinomadura sp. NBRC 104425]